MDGALVGGTLVAVIVGLGLIGFVVLVVIIRFVLGINRSLQQRDEIISLLKKIIQLQGGSETLPQEKQPDQKKDVDSKLKAALS